MNIDLLHRLREAGDELAQEKAARHKAEAALAERDKDAERGKYLLARAMREGNGIDGDSYWVIRICQNDGAAQYPKDSRYYRPRFDTLLDAIDAAIRESKP